MYRTQLAMAGLHITVEHLYNIVRFFPEGFICGETESDFAVTITETDIEYERGKIQAEYEKGNHIKPEDLPAELEFTAIYRKIAQYLPKFDAMVLHGSAVAVGDSAFLFTARSGTGKTTHTNLWLKNIPGSYIVDGDKPVVRIFEDGVKICGTPWNGKEKLGCTAVVPLRAVCFVSRGEENRIEKVTFREVIPKLIEQSYRSPDNAVLGATLRLLNRIGQSVDFYKLSCNMEDEAAFVAYKEMSR